MINVEVLFSAIPTIFGVWRDDWNVVGYLMVERAYVGGVLSGLSRAELCSPTQLERRSPGFGMYVLFRVKGKAGRLPIE